MRAIRPTGIVAALMLMLTLAGAGVPAVGAGQTDENLRACLDGYSHCDRSLLDDDARQQVTDAENRRHLQDCLHGKRCNPALLDESERRQVAAAVAQLNLENCLRGNGLCREHLLTGTERVLVEDVARQRNRGYCYDGLTACNPSWLNEAERAQAHRLYLERNFGNCVPGFERFTRCNPDDLSATQRAALGQRLRDANLYICTHALMGCIDELLTPEQRASIGTSRAAARR